MSKKSLGNYVSVKLGKKKALSIKFNDLVQFEKSFLKSYLGESERIKKHQRDLKEIKLSKDLKLVTSHPLFCLSLLFGELFCLLFCVLSSL